jgi:hypothetical protein
MWKVINLLMRIIKLTLYFEIAYPKERVKIFHLVIVIRLI